MMEFIATRHFLGLVSFVNVSSSVNVSHLSLP
jgi:hypothetical protein